MRIKWKTWSGIWKVLAAANQDQVEDMVWIMENISWSESGSSGRHGLEYGKY